MDLFTRWMMIAALILLVVIATSMVEIAEHIEEFAHGVTH